MHVYIMTRVISLSDEAYIELKKRKEENESFSDVVLRIVKHEKKKNLSKFFGAWSGPKEELDRIEKMIYEDRKKTKMRDVKF